MQRRNTDVLPRRETRPHRTATAVGAPVSVHRVRWLIDGNNVMGSRPDGWWNDRAAASRRLTQQIAEWCRTHDDEVTVVFDRPVDDTTTLLGGGNLAVESARRSGRDAADDRIVELVDATGDDRDPATEAAITVVTSDRGLIRRLPPNVRIIGAGHFLDVLDEGNRR